MQEISCICHALEGDETRNWTSEFRTISKQIKNFLLKKTQKLTTNATKFDIFRKIWENCCKNFLSEINQVLKFKNVLK